MGSGGVTFLHFCSLSYVVREKSVGLVLCLMGRVGGLVVIVCLEICNSCLTFSLSVSSGRRRRGLFWSILGGFRVMVMVKIPVGGDQLALGCLSFLLIWRADMPLTGSEGSGIGA